MPGWVTAFGAIAAVVFLIIAIMWLATSIGLLKLAAGRDRWRQSWRQTHIALLVLWLGVNLILIFPVTRPIMEQQMAQRQAASSTPPPAGFASIMSGALYAGTILGFLFGLIIPITMLACLTRKSARAAFGEGGIPSQSGFPPNYPQQ